MVFFAQLLAKQWGKWLSAGNSRDHSENKLGMSFTKLRVSSSLVYFKLFQTVLYSNCNSYNVFSHYFNNTENDWSHWPFSRCRLRYISQSRSLKIRKPENHIKVFCNVESVSWFCLWLKRACVSKAYIVFGWCKNVDWQVAAVHSSTPACFSLTPMTLSVFLSWWHHKTNPCMTMLYNLQYKHGWQYGQNKQ